MTSALVGGAGFACFAARPQVGDALLVGLSAAVPSCAVVLRMDCRVSGVGVDPRDPPLTWEAWTANGWSPCETELDQTGGLNRPGDVILHVPGTHETSIIGGERAGWLRCRLVAPRDGQRTYSESPQVRYISAFTKGGTAKIVHAEVVREEELGRSDGAPGQRFRLARHPVVPWEEPLALNVIDDDGVTRWTAVEHFASSTEGDSVFHVDPFAGEVHFGPAVRQEDGTLRRYGAAPSKGSHLRLESYRTGGGSVGNVAPGKIVVLKTSNPEIASVVNRSAAVGGADGEAIEDAMVRGPLLLRSRGRAVTADDFVQLAIEVAPELGRVQCVAAESADEARGVRVLLVPRVTRNPQTGAIALEELSPLPETLTRVTEHLTDRKLIGTRLLVEPPDYRWLTAVVSVTARATYRSDDVRIQVLQALYRLFDPLLGGADGKGWPMGRSVQSHEVNAALSRVAGVDLSQDMTIRLFPADPITRRRGQETQRLTLGPTSLVHSFEHQVRVRP